MGPLDELDVLLATGKLLVWPTELEAFEETVLVPEGTRAAVVDCVFAIRGVDVELAEPVFAPFCTGIRLTAAVGVEVADALVTPLVVGEVPPKLRGMV